MARERRWWQSQSADATGRAGSSARGRTDRADDLRLPTAHPAHDGKDGEAVSRRQAAENLARLLEADTDLERKARRAQPSLMAGEHAAKTVDDGMRAVGGPQPRCAKAIEAALVQSLIRQAPGDRLACAQLFAAYRTCLATNSGLHVGKSSGSAPRRAHGSVRSNHGASDPV